MTSFSSFLPLFGAMLALAFPGSLAKMPQSRPPTYSSMIWPILGPIGVFVRGESFKRQLI
jgi:hypothetical protein